MNPLGWDLGAALGTRKGFPCGYYWAPCWCRPGPLGSDHGVAETRTESLIDFNLPATMAWTGLFNPQPSVMETSSGVLAGQPRISLIIYKG